MSLIELERLTDAQGGFIEQYPDRQHGLITSVIEAESHIEELYHDSIFYLSSFPSGTEAFVDDHRYVLVHGNTHGNPVTSLEKKENVKFLRGGTVVFTNHAYSAIQCEDGIVRGEDHIFDDVHPKYAPARRYERIETVQAIAEDGKKLFTQVADALRETWHLSA